MENESRYIPKVEECFQVSDNSPLQRQPKSFSMLCKSKRKQIPLTNNTIKTTPSNEIKGNAIYCNANNISISYDQVDNDTPPRAKSTIGMRINQNSKQRYIPMRNINHKLYKSPEWQISTYESNKKDYEEKKEICPNQLRNSFKTSCEYVSQTKPKFLQTTHSNKKFEPPGLISLIEKKSIIPFPTTIRIKQFLSQLNKNASNNLSWKDNINNPQLALNNLCKVYRLDFQKIKYILSEYYKKVNGKPPTSLLDALKCAKITKISESRIKKDFDFLQDNPFQKHIYRAIRISKNNASFAEKLYTFEEYMKIYKFSHPKMLNVREKYQFVSRV